MAFYNYVRSHMSLGREPIPAFKGEEWQKMLMLVLKARGCGEVDSTDYELSSEKL